MDTVRLLIDSGRVNCNVTDSLGKTVVHHVVCPLPFGSYENADMLEYLVTRGDAHVDMVDNDGRTSLYYAMLQDSGTMRCKLEQLGAAVAMTTDRTATVPTRASSVVLSSEWEDFAFNYELDADDVLGELRRQLDNAAARPPRVDTHSGMAGPAVCVFSEDIPGKIRVYYDAQLVKVDIKQGPYGVNNFYVMQLLYDSLKDLYVLWTRWGRVGEIGQSQRTPMPSAAEAVAEFKKLFRSKTGNHFVATATGPTSFVKFPEKYAVLRAGRAAPPSMAGCVPRFDYTAADFPVSTLPVELQETFDVLTNTEVLEGAFRGVGVDTTVMPFGSVPREAIHEARRLLGNIKPLVAERERLLAAVTAVGGSLGLAAAAVDGVDTASHGAADHERLRQVGEQLTELSNRLFSLIPHPQFSEDIIRPIESVDDLRREMKMLYNIEQLDIAAKLLLGAQRRLRKGEGEVTMHPFDYVFRSLNIMLERFEPHGDEYRALMRYAGAGNELSCSGRVLNIFRMQRRGEGERIQKWKNVGNHYLLWHGTSVANVLSILAGGLKIAPHEAVALNGASLGKGIYFADTFSHSLNFVSYGGRSPNFVAVQKAGVFKSREEEVHWCEKQRGYLLLCEVALGNIATNPGGANRLPEGYHSVKATNSVDPDPMQKIVLPNGVTLPWGPHASAHTSYRSEYVVFDESQVRMIYLVEVVA